MSKLKLTELIINRQQKIDEEEAAGEPMFMGLPDRWYEDLTFRCINNHVSKRILKNSHSGDLCFRCFEGTIITFPEDKE
jgi:hypothetical protein